MIACFGGTRSSRARHQRRQRDQRLPIRPRVSPRCAPSLRSCRRVRGRYRSWLATRPAGSTSSPLARIEPASAREKWSTPSTADEVVGPTPSGGTIVNDSAAVGASVYGDVGADSALKCPIVCAPGRFGTIQTASPSTPRLQAARALADVVVQALEGGDVVGARAAAAALREFIERLDGKDFPGSLDPAEAKVRNG